MIPCPRDSISQNICSVQPNNGHRACPGRPPPGHRLDGWLAGDRGRAGRGADRPGRGGLGDRGGGRRRWTGPPAVDLVWVVAARPVPPWSPPRWKRTGSPRSTSRGGTASPTWSPSPGTSRRRSSAPRRTSPARRRPGWPPTGIPAFGLDAADDLMRPAAGPVPRRAGRTCGRSAPTRPRRCSRRWPPGGPASVTWTSQARVAAVLEAAGRDAPVLIVGGDDRVRRFRHPMAVGAPVRHLAMAVVVARRGGLHAAATRFAGAGPLDRSSRALRARVLRIERDTLAASGTAEQLRRRARRAGPAATPGKAPRAAGPGHYQGGPIGYAQREFEIAPCQRDSRWYGTRVEARARGGLEPEPARRGQGRGHLPGTGGRAGAGDHRHRAGRPRTTTNCCRRARPYWRWPSDARR